MTTHPAKAAKTRFSLESICPYLYILPSLLLFSLFVFFPFAKTLFLSLSLTDQAGSAIDFVGLDNFRSVLLGSSSRDFWFSMGVTLRYAAMVVTGSIVLGLICAILANESFRGRGLVRTVFAMPMSISSACIAVIGVFALNPTMGIVNSLLGTNIKWLRDIHYALPSVAAVTVWMNIGLNFIFLIAALQNVDEALYEAGAIEGANFFQKHWHITLPCVSPTLFFLLIINVINAFQAYAQIRLMTQGGPGKYTRTIIYAIYLEAFQNNRYGMSAAMSVVLFIILFVLTLIQFKMEKKVTY
ncbi:MAG: sugar ABC transporter permease [Clostridiales bacterium]|nr:sugar ABC transporter permease [Clostridiales bacterium]MCI7703942.1 sugar ABC transporter permease [Clostridiales bacterium]MDY3830937.1 sugar ABC transporter permease [Candidatus Ventricola sp.]MDY4541593.1 sugar ABC transporter permease [Candidatus Ventricola sp.]MDY4854406.1 sugar ABC transporter permease [Candidatus Ventricola sp.]